MREKVFINLGEISVRNFEEYDIKNKVDWINNSENNQYLHYDLPLSENKTIEWYYKRDFEKRRDLVIEYSGVPVGLIGLLNIDYVHRKAEFYISIGNVGYKRKGISTIATRLVLQYAFTTLDLNKIYLNVDEENMSARRLYEKVGFKCEGFFESDMFHKGRYINRMRYAILRKRFETEE